MTSPVTPLTPLTDARHDPKLVERLEALLAEAKAGRLRYVVWAAAYPSDTVIYGYSENALTLELLGLLELVKGSIVQKRSTTYSTE